MNYILSDKFQAYADKSKAPWTCQVNMVLAQQLILLSRYEQAEKYLLKISPRGPKTEVAEKADFEYAHCLENRGQRSASVAAYEAFAEKYPESRRARLAIKAAGMLRTS